MKATESNETKSGLPVAAAAGVVENATMTTILVTVEPLTPWEHCGDWHDKPLRWIVKCGSKCQKFSTKRDAEKYASLWRRNNGDEFKTFKAWRNTY